MSRWHVSGHYAQIFEAETEQDAYDYALDKIGNGWEWEAEQVSETSEPDRLRSSCGCGVEVVWTPEGWQHDAAPYFWGDDHEVDLPDPHPDDPARRYWDERDGVYDR